MAEEGSGPFWEEDKDNWEQRTGQSLQRSRWQKILQLLSAAALIVASASKETQMCLEMKDVGGQEKNVPSIPNQLEYNLHKAPPVLMRWLFLGFKYRQNTNQQTLCAAQL